jgi:hypothetical protein
MIENLNIDIDYDKLLENYHDLNIDDRIYKNHGLKQLAIQCRTDALLENQLIESCGSLYYDWPAYTGKGDLPLRKEIFEEEQFNSVCEIFKNTLFEELIKKIQQNYDIIRGRFMLMQHKTCLTYHKDPSKRIHIPIYTNNNCMMIIDNQVYRMPFGATYLVDTTVPHTALNASKDPRVHLVFCLNT